MKTTYRSVIAAFATAAVMFGTTSAQAAQCTNDTWNKVMKKGKLVVGVKADYKPWGYRDQNGAIVGLEVDMAQAAADAMGVELETIEVKSSNRIQFLEQGKIDLMIATLLDTADRRKAVGIVQPNYYSSGTNVLAPKSAGLSSWEDLKGQPICGKEGAYYNEVVSERYGADVIPFPSNGEGKQALKEGQCIAWLYNDSSVMSDLASGDYDDYEMPLESEDEANWGLAVPLAEKDCVFGHFMSGLTYNMHQSGQLVELERKWGIQPTKYLARQNELFSDWLAQ